MKNYQQGSMGVVIAIIIALIIIGGVVYYEMNKSKGPFLPGCDSASGYSTSTGQKCDSSTTTTG